MPEGEHALGKYRPIAEIGRGGMADVYLAVVQGPAGFNKLVVLKKTRRDLAQDPEFLTMFLDEARLAARLNHPNVVQTIEVGEDGDRYFIAMEYLDGQPLNRIRTRVGADLPLVMQLRVLADALLGLHYAHELCDFDGSPLAVVHRDATPQNIFVTYDGLVKLVDFGIAKAIDSSSDTRTGVVKGKVTYMAPEQARGERVDRRADVFAVGVMLWEAAAGRRMWKGMPDIKILHEILAGRFPSIREAVPTIAAELASIIDKALALSPADRYPTAQAMHDDLVEYLAEVAPKGVSAREVGIFVSERFSDDRAKVKSVIEDQLKDLRWTGVHPRSTAMDLPKIDPGQPILTPSRGFEPSRPPSARPSMTSSTRLVSEPPVDVAGQLHSLTNATAALPALPSDAPVKPVRLSVLLGVGAIASAIVVSLGVHFVGLPDQGRANGADSGAASTSSAMAGATGQASTGAPAAAATNVKLTVRVTPPNATVYLDGAVLGSGTFEGRVVRSDTPKHIRIEAPHYAPKEETITLDGDTMLSFALERDSGAAAAPGPPRPRPTGAAPEPTAKPAETATPGQKPKRAIDTENPY